MERRFCDLCGRETELKDIRKLKVEDLEGKPMLKEKEICVFCKEKLTNLLSHWENACVSETGTQKPSPV